MPANKPEIFNPDELLNWYDLQGDDFAAWRIYAGEKPHPHYCRGEYYGTEKMQGREELQAAAEAIRQNPQNTNRYCLEVFTDEVLQAEKKRGAKKDAKRLPVKTIVFQFNGGEQYKPLGAMAGFSDPGVMQLLKQQNEILAVLSSKVAAIEAANEIEEDEEDEAAPDAIGSLLQNPQLQAMAINFLSGILAPKPNAQPAAVAGIPEDTQLQNAIEILKKNDPQVSDHLYKLAQLSEKNPAFFQTLIGMLNGMAI
jgi:hypothetical protein